MSFGYSEEFRKRNAAYYEQERQMANEAQRTIDRLQVENYTLLVGLVAALAAAFLMAVLGGFVIAAIVLGIVLVALIGGWLWKTLSPRWK